MTGYLTRALLGGGGRLNAPPPSGFPRIAKKRRRAAPPDFTHLTPNLFRNFCENFDPMPCEVRSPGQVKWPNYKITFQSRHGYNVSGKVMKLLEYDEVTSAYKTYISDFLYRGPKVRSFLRPPHYKSMGKKSTLLYLLWRKPIWVESYRLGQLWTIWLKICIAYPSKGLDKVIVYIVWRALTRQTRWYQNRCSTFQNKDFIVEKPFWKILEF